MLHGLWRTGFDKGKNARHERTGADAENPDQGMEVTEADTAADMDQPAERMLSEAVQLHQRGIHGDREAVVKAYELLIKARELLPENNLVEAYYGSAMTLLGRDSIDPMERFNKAIRGLKILDGAVSKEPENIEIRTLRAYVCHGLPEMYFHRTATAVEDFNYLIWRYEQDPGVFDQDFYWKLLHDLEAANKELGRIQEADAAREKLLSIAGETKYNELLAQDSLNLSVPAGIQDLDSSPDEASMTGKNKEEMLEEGLKLHELAVSGEAGAAKKAFAFFTKAAASDPRDLLFKAYYADCLSLVGRFSMDPGQMFTNAIQAMKLFDEIVNQNPENLRIRMIRAYHSFRLPEGFFRRTAAAIADFEYLIQRYENDHSSFAGETYQQILYDLGVAYQRLGLEKEASAVKAKLMSLDPDPKFIALFEKEENDNKVVNQMNLLAVDQKSARLEEGIRLHDLAVAGNKKAAKLALELLEKAHQEDPTDPVAMGYYGSCLALSARDSMDTQMLFRNGIKGFKLLNRALSRDGNNFRLRLLRAYLTYSLPEAFFHLTHRALKDFRYLKTAYEQDNNLFSRELYHQILYDMGVAYERTGDSVKAKKVWSKLLQASDDLKYRELLEIKYRELLERKGVNQE